MTWLPKKSLNNKSNLASCQVGQFSKVLGTLRKSIFIQKRHFFKSQKKLTVQFAGK
jgi:hypothetical protein